MRLWPVFWQQLLAFWKNQNSLGLHSLEAEIRWIHFSLEYSWKSLQLHRISFHLVTMWALAGYRSAKLWASSTGSGRWRGFVWGLLFRVGTSYLGSVIGYLLSDPDWDGAERGVFWAAWGKGFAVHLLGAGSLHLWHFQLWHLMAPIIFMKIPWNGYEYVHLDKIYR